jgi:hypothetical protein
MVTAAEVPREIIANVFLGERLRDEQDGVYQELGVTVTREYRPTKEYPRGQEVYALTFDHRGEPGESSEEGGTVDEDGTEPETPAGTMPS